MNENHCEEPFALDVFEVFAGQGDVMGDPLARRLMAALGLSNSLLGRYVRIGLAKIERSWANRSLHYTNQDSLGVSDFARIWETQMLSVGVTSLSICEPASAQSIVDFERQADHRADPSVLTSTAPSR